jgi:hypothetical protein
VSRYDEGHAYALAWYARWGGSAPYPDITHHLAYRVLQGPPAAAFLAGALAGLRDAIDAWWHGRRLTSN